MLYICNVKTMRQQKKVTTLKITIMKAKELMIGDFIFVNGKITKVENIFNKCINYCQDIPCVQEEDYVQEEDIEPIPLTDDILEKNGFTNGNYHNEYDIDGTNFYVVEFCDTYSYQDTDMEIRYVHELQHALRLCGLVELADNFKI